MNRTPESYKKVSWRCTLPVDRESQCMGIAFTYEDDSAVRVQLPIEDAQKLAETISEFLENYRTNRKSPVHSESSAEIPSSDVSMEPDKDGLKV